VPREDFPLTPTKVELGCGTHKRAGFYGIDVAAGPEVDLVLDIERSPLPFPNGSVNYVYSSHTFEHLEAPGSPIQTLREIMRVCEHGATVEVWTPHGKSNDALLFGHRVFYTETHWKHICFEYDDFYLGKDSPGRFEWIRTQYVLFPQILDSTNKINVPIVFALEHMTNIAMEFGVFLRVDKTIRKAKSPQFPIRELCYERGNILRKL
jgi:SAM-dependent methyltransferase